MITFGSGNGDTYQYDTNTDCMNEFVLSVYGSLVTGTLSWNANGTLGGLTIADQINPANNQNCTYTHDDLGRLAEVNCGTNWTQTLGLDPFGNLSKSVPGGSSGVSFAASYSASTNRISRLPGATIRAPLWC